MRHLHILNFDCDQTSCQIHPVRDCVPAAVKSPSADSPKAKLLLVSSMPSELDARRKKAWLSSTSTTILNMVQLAGAPAGGYAYTDRLRCRPKDRNDHIREVTHSELEFCSAHFKRDLDTIEPEVLLIFGEDTFRHIFPNYKGKFVYNRVLTLPLYDKSYTVICTASKRALADHAGLSSFVLEAVVKAVDITNHGEASFFHPAQWKVNPEIVYCDTLEKIKEMVDFLANKTKATDYVALDVETKNLNARYRNQLTMIQFCVDPRDKVWVVPYQYMHGPFMDDDLPAIREELQKLFLGPVNFKAWLTFFGDMEQKIVSNFLLDRKTFKNKPMIDVCFQMYLDNENRVDFRKNIDHSMNLKVATAEMVSRDEYNEETLVARSKGKLYALPPDRLIPYAAEDVIATQLVFRFLRAKLKADGYWTKAEKLLINMASGTLRLFAKMKMNGFPIDRDHLKLLADKNGPLMKRLAEIEQEFKKIDSVKKTNDKIVAEFSGNQKPLFGTPWKYQITKPAHNKKLVYGTLGLEPLEPKRGAKTASPSVDKAFYEEYSDTVPEVAMLEDFTQLRKLATTYTNSIIGYVDPSYNDGSPDFDNSDCSTDCRIRSDFGLYSTVSGRPASFNPNVQNVPRADDLIKALIKSMYCAHQADGKPYVIGSRATHCIMQLDYMAAEVRIAAILSGDKNLADALMKGKLIRDQYRKNPTPEMKKLAEIEGDIHKQTASLMFGVPVEQVTKDMRQKTKAIVFALLYGGGAHLVAQRIGNDNIEEVTALCNKFYDTFPDLSRWLKIIEQEASDQLYVESPIGRRRHLIQFITDDSEAKGSARRYARNSPIQGFASDACLIGASLFNDYIEDNNKSWEIVNIVHDSCVTIIPITDMREASAIAEKCFSTRLMNFITKTWGVNFIAPLEVEFDFGIRWGDMHSSDGTEADLAHIEQWLLSGGYDVDVKTKKCPTCGSH